MRRMLAVMLGLTLVAGTSALAEVEPLAPERPVLRKIIPYTLADMNNDIAGQRMEEITGYQVIYEVLPQDNPSQKLLLEVATGTGYDIIKCTTEQFTALKSQGALYDLAPYVEAYGENLVIDEMARKAQLVTGAQGGLYGLPLMNNPTMENPYGMIRHGFAIRSDIMQALGLALPETLPDFADFLRAIQAETGVSPLSVAGSVATVWVLPVLSAYGLGEAEWYEVDGCYVPRVRMPAMADYLGYMQMLYREGLLDAEFPINKTENTIAKLSTGQAYATTMYFWDIPTAMEAFAANGVETGLEMIGTLRRDAGTPAVYYVDYGVYYIFCVPKSSRHVADAVYYMNLQSAPDTFLKTYLGEEGVQYEVVDGQYYPLFPGFDEYLNAAQYTALSPEGNEFILWQARARKTPEMSAAYDQMNGVMDTLELHPYYASYAYGLPGTELRAQLNTMVAEMLLDAIVDGTEPKAAMAAIVAAWEAQGGLQFEAAMQGWYEAERAGGVFFTEP